MTVFDRVSRGTDLYTGVTEGTIDLEEFKSTLMKLKEEDPELFEFLTKHFSLFSNRLESVAWWMENQDKVPLNTSPLLAYPHLLSNRDNEVVALVDFLINDLKLDMYSTASGMYAIFPKDLTDSGTIQAILIKLPSWGFDFNKLNELVDLDLPMQLLLATRSIGAYTINYLPIFIEAGYDIHNVNARGFNLLSYAIRNMSEAGSGPTERLIKELLDLGAYFQDGSTFAHEDYLGDLWVKAIMHSRILLAQFLENGIPFPKAHRGQSFLYEFLHLTMEYVVNEEPIILKAVEQGLPIGELDEQGDVALTRFFAVGDTFSAFKLLGIFLKNNLPVDTVTADGQSVLHVILKAILDLYREYDDVQYFQRQVQFEYVEQLAAKLGEKIHSKDQYGLTCGDYLRQIQEHRVQWVADCDNPETADDEYQQISRLVGLLFKFGLPAVVFDDENTAWAVKRGVPNV